MIISFVPIFHVVYFFFLFLVLIPVIQSRRVASSGLYEDLDEM